MSFRALLCSAALTFLLFKVGAAEPVKVRFQEGSEHAFLALRTLDGKLLASGDLVQKVSGGKLTSHLVYRFKDGSVDDESAVFTQNGTFQLLRDHRVQKGPSFPRATDVSMDVKTGTVTVRSVVDGREKVDTRHMDLPDDLANGMILMLIENLAPYDQPSTVSYLAPTPKPTIVRLMIRKDGTDSFRSAGMRETAQRYRVHVEIGGLAGLLAPMLGKEPADSFVWISGTEVPAFIKSESPLYVGGPLLRTELVGPVWQSAASERTKHDGR